VENVLSMPTQINPNKFVVKSVRRVLPLKTPRQVLFVLPVWLDSTATNAMHVNRGSIEEPKIIQPSVPVAKPATIKIMEAKLCASPVFLEDMKMKMEMIRIVNPVVLIRTQILLNKYLVNRVQLAKAISLDRLRVVIVQLGKRKSTKSA
jgi:hypothetical protein